MEISEGIVLVAIGLTVVVTVVTALLWLSGALYGSDAAHSWTSGQTRLRGSLTRIWDWMRAAVRWLTRALNGLVGHWTPHRWGIVLGLTAMLALATAADVFLLTNYFSDRLQQRTIVHIAAAFGVLMITLLPGIVFQAGGFSVYHKLIGDEAQTTEKGRSSATIVIAVFFQVIVLIGMIFLADDRVTLLHDPTLHPDSGPAVGTERFAWILLFVALAVALSLLHGVGFDLLNLVQVAMIAIPLALAGFLAIVASFVVGGLLILMAVLGWLFTLLANIAHSIGFAPRLTPAPLSPPTDK